MLDSYFISMLAMTVRLHDLYDLKRTPGSSGQNTPPVNHEHVTGQWTEVGIRMLMYLVDRDDQASESFVPQTQILDEAKMFPGVEGFIDSDFVTILHNLCTPCTLSFPTFQPSQVHEETALIEKAVAGSSYRVTPSARSLLSLVNHAQRIDYAPEFISMLFKDLEQGRYDDFSRNCVNLVDTIRSHSRKVTKVRERSSAATAFRHEVLDSIERHMELAKEIGAKVDELRKTLSSEEVQEKVFLHEENTGDMQILGRLHADLKRIPQAAISLHRNLSKLFDSFHDKKAGGLSGFSLQSIAEEFWAGTIPVKRFRRAMSIHGIWSPNINYGSLFDSPRKLQGIKEKPFTDTVFEPLQKPVSESMIYDFLREHRAELKVLLEEGPVTVKMLMDKGLLGTQKAEEVTRVVGMCFNPEWLDGKGERILVSRVGGEVIRHSLMTGDVFTMDDIQLEIIKEQRK